MWCIPEADAAYVACMEEVLEQYQQAYDLQCPLVCFDEVLQPLIEESRRGYPAGPGRRARYDYHYERHGVRNLHLCFEPLTGLRHFLITERRTQKEFATCMRWLVDELYPQAKTIRVVLDNLNTHTAAALYRTFPPAEALRILKKLEFHFTPKHGSWLNMAEIEWSIYSRSLPAHIPNEDILRIQVDALTWQRNRAHRSVNWQFRTRDARIKLKRLYPSLSA